MSPGTEEPRGALADAERRAEQLEREAALGELAAGVAHDLNNVLATISVLATLLRNGEDDARRLSSLSQIDSAIDNASRLTRAVLDFGRPGEGDPGPDRARALVREVAELVGRACGSRIGLRFDCRAQRTILGDRARLGQLVMNLAVNARDAIEGEGEISFRTYDVELAAEDAKSRSAARPGLARRPRSLGHRRRHRPFAARAGLRAALHHPGGRNRPGPRHRPARGRPAPGLHRGRRRGRPRGDPARLLSARALKIRQGAGFNSPSGSTGSPSLRTSKCRCGPEVRPESPTVATTWPSRTFWPVLTRRSRLWA